MDLTILEQETMPILADIFVVTSQEPTIHKFDASQIQAIFLKNDSKIQGRPLIPLDLSRESRQ
jgi:hypothetical protein